MILLPSNWPSWIKKLRENQIQPAGVDLTLSEVMTFTSPGKLTINNEKRVLSSTRKIEPKNNYYELQHGSYLIRYNEKIEIPSNAIGLVFPRSSLMRMGATLYTAVWDPGYIGRGISLLTVFNKIIIEKKARVAQLVLIKTEKNAEKLYNGVFQGEE